MTVCHANEVLSCDKEEVQELKLFKESLTPLGDICEKIKMLPQITCRATYRTGECSLINILNAIELTYCKTHNKKKEAGLLRKEQEEYIEESLMMHFPSFLQSSVQGVGHIRLSEEEAQRLLQMWTGQAKIHGGL